MFNLILVISDFILNNNIICNISNATLHPLVFILCHKFVSGYHNFLLILEKLFKV